MRVSLYTDGLDAMSCNITAPHPFISVTLARATILNFDFTLWDRIMNNLYLKKQIRFSVQFQLLHYV